jgi:hypothetical protein
MAAYLIAIGTAAEQLTASLRRTPTAAVSQADTSRAGRRSFLGVLLSALAAWPC